MTTHHFRPDHYHNTIGSHEPVLCIADGDTVVTTTADAWGADAHREQVAARPNPQTGPFYVEGAPGVGVEREPGAAIRKPARSMLKAQSRATRWCCIWTA
jgi:hypothetical protein